MERLHQVALALFVGVKLLTGDPLFGADSYCSLSVRVLSPDGRRPRVPVSVEDSNGRVLDREQASGNVRFCDLGIRPVTVTVGLPGCNQVVVKDVPLTWKNPYLLTVTYDGSPCFRDYPPPPVPTCQILFRVSDVAGKWIQGATVQFDPGGPAQRATDDAGRAFVTSRLDQQIGGMVSATGYLPQPFSLTCRRGERIQEEVIKLRLPDAR